MFHSMVGLIYFLGEQVSEASCQEKQLEGCSENFADLKEKSAEQTSKVSDKMSWH